MNYSVIERYKRKSIHMHIKKYYGFNQMLFPQSDGLDIVLH